MKCRINWYIYVFRNILCVLRLHMNIETINLKWFRPVCHRWAGCIQGRGAAQSVKHLRQTQSALYRSSAVLQEGGLKGRVVYFCPDVISNRRNDSSKVSFGPKKDVSDVSGLSTSHIINAANGTLKTSEKLEEITRSQQVSDSSTFQWLWPD